MGAVAPRWLLREDASSYEEEAGMRLVTLSTLLVVAIAAAAAAPFAKPYFAKTKPGTWAQYRQTGADGQTIEYVYSRLSDQGGNAWIEIAMEITAGTFKGTKSVSSYLVSTEVPIEQDALGYARRLRRAAGQSNDVRATEYEATVVAAIVKGSIDYASVLKPKGSDSMAGRACDIYTYTWSHTVSKMEEMGEFCLSESVPFGVVRQVSTQKDAAGKITKYEMVLTATGGDAASRLTGFSWGAATAAADARPASPASGAGPATPSSSSSTRGIFGSWRVSQRPSPPYRCQAWRLRRASLAFTSGSRTTMNSQFWAFDPLGAFSASSMSRSTSASSTGSGLRRLTARCVVMASASGMEKSHVSLIETSSLRCERPSARSRRRGAA